MQSLRVRYPERRAVVFGWAKVSCGVVAHPKIEGLEKLPFAKWHLEKCPFKAPVTAHECVAWHEGSFNPMHEGHAFIVQRLLEMGFRTVVVGTVPKNPHKPEWTALPLSFE